ncbi:MAG: hypothetical protein ABIB79_00765 [archaeon]
MEKDIGKINKNDTTDIVLRVDDFGGRPGLTIREFVTSDRYTGFTKSGVRILAADFPKFKEMINSVKEDDLKVQEAPEEKEVIQQPADQTTLTEESEDGSVEVERVKPSEGRKEELPDY